MATIKYIEVICDHDCVLSPLLHCSICDLQALQELLNEQSDTLIYLKSNKIEEYYFKPKDSEIEVMDSLKVKDHEILQGYLKMIHFDKIIENIIDS